MPTSSLFFDPNRAPPSIKQEEIAGEIDTAMSLEELHRQLLLQRLGMDVEDIRNRSAGRGATFGGSRHRQAGRAFKTTALQLNENEAELQALLTKLNRNLMLSSTGITF